jgi:hypothetical protein
MKSAREVVLEEVGVVGVETGEEEEDESSSRICPDEENNDMKVFVALRTFCHANQHGIRKSGCTSLTIGTLREALRFIETIFNTPLLCFDRRASTGGFEGGGGLDGGWGSGPPGRF